MKWLLLIVLMLPLACDKAEDARLRVVPAMYDPNRALIEYLTDPFVESQGKLAEM